MAQRTPVVNYLTGKQVYDYMEEVKKNDNLFTIIRELYNSKMDKTEDVTKEEMDEIVDTTTDPDSQNALKCVTLVGDGQTLLTLDNTDRTKYQKALVVYERRTDRKYDVLVVYATKIKGLTVRKLVAYAFGSICAGIAIGFITMNPAVGVGTAIVLVAGSGAKAAYGYTKEIPDVLFGYILQDLIQKNVLKIKSSNNIQFVIN